METEYKITYKKPEWKYCGEIGTSFENYSDAETELKMLVQEGSSGTYRIIKINYEVVREDILIK